MTAAELIVNARRLFGERVYKCATETWAYSHRKDADATEIRCHLYSDPAIDARVGSHLYGESFEEIAERLGELVSDQLMASSGVVDEEPDSEYHAELGVNSNRDLQMP